MDIAVVAVRRFDVRLLNFDDVGKGRSAGEPHTQGEELQPVVDVRTHVWPQGSVKVRFEAVK